MQKDDYNQIFEQLVEDDGNLIGLIAYGLYKNEKRKEIIKIKETGKNPTKRQINRIESVLSNQLELFTEQANDLLDATFELIILENKESIYCEHFLQDDVEKLSKRASIWTRLWESLFFRLIWIVLIGLIGYAIYSNSDSLKSFGEKINNTFTEQNSE
jgi:hypothetical protein